MQIFKVIELKEHPYMTTEEIFEGEKVADIIKEGSEETEEEVYLLVDHDSKRILTYNGKESSFKKQFYGGILAKMLRSQLHLFYRVHPLNTYSKDDDIYTELWDKSLGAGKARAIEKSDFLEESTEGPSERDLSVHIGLKPNQALEYLDELPDLEDFDRTLAIVGNSIYADVEKTKKVLTDDITETTPELLGKLNRGFTFFEGTHYSTRILVKNRIVQGFEIFLPKDETLPKHEVKVPVIYEEKFKKGGTMDQLMAAFQIPDEWIEEEE